MRFARRAASAIASSHPSASARPPRARSEARRNSARTCMDRASWIDDPPVPLVPTCAGPSAYARRCARADTRGNMSDPNAHEERTMMRSIRRWGTLGVASAIALMGASCTGGATGSGTTEQAAAGPATVEVMLSEFTIDPSAIAVPVGQPIEFSVMNMGQAPHTFAVDVAGTTYETDAHRSRYDRRPEGSRPRRRNVSGVLHGVRAQGPRHAGHGHGGNGRSRRRSHRVELRRPGNRGPRNQYERGDDGVDAQGGCRRIPRGQPDADPGEPALGTHDGRHHEGLRAHRVQREVGGVEGTVRGCDGVQRPDPGPADRRRVRRPHPDRGARTSSTSRPSSTSTG